MAQSGYLFTENGMWKVRYRIKNQEGEWRWAPVHVLGSTKQYPNKSEALVAKNEFMAEQNAIVFRAETAGTIDEFVESAYFPDIEGPGIYNLDASTIKTYRGNWRKHLEPLLQGRMIRTFKPCDAEE